MVPKLDSGSSPTIVRNKISENLESCIGKDRRFVIKAESSGKNLDRHFRESGNPLIYNIITFKKSGIPTCADITSS